MNTNINIDNNKLITCVYANTMYNDIYITPNSFDSIDCLREAYLYDHENRNFNIKEFIIIGYTDNEGKLYFPFGKHNYHICKYYFKDAIKYFIVEINDEEYIQGFHKFNYDKHIDPIR